MSDHIFIDSITTDLVSQIKLKELTNCPYCDYKLYVKMGDYSRKTLVEVYKPVYPEIKYLYCPKCKLSFTGYLEMTVPRLHISLVNFLKVIFSPDLSPYELYKTLEVSYSTIHSIRKQYILLIELMNGFRNYFHTPEFKDFIEVYEEENNIKEYEEITGKEMPTRNNGNTWLYHYIFDKR